MAKRKKVARSPGRSKAEITLPPPPSLPAAQTPNPPAPAAVYRVERWPHAHAPNPAMLRDILARDGYTVYQWSDPPGTIYGMHRHDSAQSHWIASGELEICVEGRGTFSLRAGDRDIVPANTYHSARVISDEPAFYLVGEMISDSTQR